jgi:hypothetical protein
MWSIPQTNNLSDWLARETFNLKAVGSSPTSGDLSFFAVRHMCLFCCISVGSNLFISTRSDRLRGRVNDGVVKVTVSGAIESGMVCKRSIVVKHGKCMINLTNSGYTKSKCTMFSTFLHIYLSQRI